MKTLINKYNYKSIAEANMASLKRVARTNKYAQGNRYELRETQERNSLGFLITYYNIYQIA